MTLACLVRSFKTSTGIGQLLFNRLIGFDFEITLWSFRFQFALQFGYFVILLFTFTEIVIFDPFFI